MSKHLCNINEHSLDPACYIYTHSLVGECVWVSMYVRARCRLGSQRGAHLWLIPDGRVVVTARGDAVQHPQKTEEWTKLNSAVSVCVFMCGPKWHWAGPGRETRGESKAQQAGAIGCCCFHTSAVVNAWNTWTNLCSWRQLSDFLSLQKWLR